MKFTTLFALIATASAIKLETPDFNYDSTGGHTSVKSLPSSPPATNSIVRGMGDSGNRSNTASDGTPVVEKMLL